MRLRSLLILSVCFVGCSQPMEPPSPRLGFGLPCGSNSGCTSDLCVTLAERTFCTTSCEDDCDCPDEYVCLGATDTLSVCAPGDNPCYAPPPPPPPSAIELPFDPSNLDGWIHGRSYGTTDSLVIGPRGCTGCGCQAPAIFDTDTGSIVCAGGFAQAGFEVFRQPGAPTGSLMETVGVFIFRSLRITGDVIVRVEGSRPAVIAVQDAVHLEGGTVQVAAGGWTGGVRTTSNPRGGGPGGGGYSTRTFGGGGEGGAYCTLGGLGAEMSSGAGRTYGAAPLVYLQGGSGGGSPGGGVAGDGGNGGGALQLVSGTLIEVGPAAMVTVAGSNGAGPSEGGGGGSGGALLLEAPEVRIRGEISADGGLGGVFETPGATRDMDAEDGRTEAGVYSDYGGGGGGYGRIRINSSDGTADVAVDAIVSPSTVHPCTSTARLAPRSSSPPPPSCPDASLPSDEDCAACAASLCCSEMQRCQAETLCATCRDSTTPGPACADDPAYQNVSSCFAGSCPTIC